MSDIVERPLLERLRRKGLFHDEMPPVRLVNPDGPEAAALIAQLCQALDCLLSRFCELNAECGNNSEKQSEVSSARATLAKARS